MRWSRRLSARPLIAWATGGRYYIARSASRPPLAEGGAAAIIPIQPIPATSSSPGDEAADAPYLATVLRRCVICERDYEAPDLAHCPAYRGAICSLCCTLDARCGDLCKPEASLSVQWSALLRYLLPRPIWPYLDTGLSHFLLLMLLIAPLLATVFGLLYQQELNALTLVAELSGTDLDNGAQVALRSGFWKAYLVLLLISGIVAWWLVLAHQSREVAQEESNRQTGLLMREIELHRMTDTALQAAKLQAERARQAADLANQAKSRYISAISHELRTPLNSILGYAQLMGEDASVPPHRKQAVNVIRRGGEHLLQLIEGTLDIARIESGKLTLDVRAMHLADALHEMAGMFEPQAAAKGLTFNFEVQGTIPEVVRADEKRVRQILINLLGNAIKFTSAGQVTLRVRYAREMAILDIEDTGPGLTAQEIEHIFEPFARANSAHSTAPGAGLGLTIAKMLTALMGGELSVTSQPGRGSVFRVRLFLPEVHASSARPAPTPRPRRGYLGPRRQILVVDNEEADRELLVELLKPLGFELRQAASGHDALDLLALGYQPDVIFMDLAMPGIDGWETLRRVRQLGLRHTHCAIVSANAFDKALDNDVGIRPEDFIVKPVRHSELLDWIGQRLGLSWVEDASAAAPAPAPSPAPPAALRYPNPAALEALAHSAQLGYYRGILNALEQIEREQPGHEAFVHTVRDLARQFQFDAIQQLLQRAPRDPST